jgi:hypothetical protein
MNLKTRLPIHKTVKEQKSISLHENRVICLKNLTTKQRNELEAKMGKIFKENVKGLSKELQKILLDDLVTAFQNRVSVLARVQRKSGY